MRIPRLVYWSLLSWALLSAEARAHFLFIRIGPPAEAGRAAEVFFSEQAEAGDPRFVAKIAHTKLWLLNGEGKVQPLKVVKAADRLRAHLPVSGSLAVLGECQYGVLARPKQTPFLLRYFPKAIAGSPEDLNRLPACTKVPLEIAAKFDGDKITFTAMHNGKPLPGAVFHTVDSSLANEKLTADAEGKAVWKPSSPETYSVYTSYTTKEAGKLGGLGDQTYEEIREFATLAFTWPLAGKGADPKAVALFEEAIATRAQWQGFPGFKARIAGKVDGRSFQGNVTIDAAGTVQLKTNDEATRPWVQDQLESMAMHRGAGSSAQRAKPVLRFGDTETDHPLGRLLIFEGGRFASSYRVKDRQIAVVNRNIGKRNMTITVLDNEKNKDGKFLPRSYTVQYWDAAGGELKSTETIVDHWTRVGAWDLPTTHTVTAASGSGLSVRSFTLAKHELLPTAGNWPQFKGPNGTGRAAGRHKLPDRIGPKDNLVWKIPLPPGHSSPIVWGDRIYVTAAKDRTLSTIGIERSTGRVLWEARAPSKTLEKIHSIGSRAQPTPATDGERVVSLFGSSGLFCYDKDGKPLWNIPMGPFKNDFGAGSSPLIVDDRVILNQDHDTDSFLMAIDKRTGKPIWKTDRSEFPRGYATPVIWEVEGKKQIVIAGTLRTIGYDFATGKEIWTIRGLARISNMTPQVGEDGILYIAAWAPGGDDGDRIALPPFDEMLKNHDKNGNGTLEANEVPAGPIQDRFTQIDRDKDGHITRAEYENMRGIFATAQNLVVAVKPGGKGDITSSHVLWKQKKMLPYVPSPLYVHGQLFLVKNGGIVSSLDARTGKPVKSERVAAAGNYYSSPVAGDGKIYLVNQRGQVTVLSAAGKWHTISQTRLEEEVFATPAIADGQIFIRGNDHLYCFGLAKGK